MTNPIRIVPAHVNKCTLAQLAAGFADQPSGFGAFTCRGHHDNGIGALHFIDEIPCAAGEIAQPALQREVTARGG